MNLDAHPVIKTMVFQGRQQDFEMMVRNAPSLKSITYKDIHDSCFYLFTHRLKNVLFENCSVLRQDIERLIKSKPDRLEFRNCSLGFDLDYLRDLTLRSGCSWSVHQF